MKIGDLMIKPRLKIRMDELEIKQVAVAKLLNVTPQTVNAWSKGKKTPSLETAFALADILECKIEDIFTYIKD